LTKSNNLKSEAELSLHKIGLDKYHQGDQIINSVI